MQAFCNTHSDFYMEKTEDMFISNDYTYFTFLTMTSC